MGLKGTRQYVYFVQAVDGWNLDDDNLDSCERFVAENTNDVSPSDIAAERRCLASLRGLTEDERASALALHNGFWGG